MSHTENPATLGAPLGAPSASSVTAKDPEQALGGPGKQPIAANVAGILEA